MEKVLALVSAAAAVALVLVARQTKLTRTVIKTGASAFYNGAHAVGGIVYMSGQVAVAGKDAMGRPVLAKGGIAAESRQALSNFKKVLESAGSSCDRVLKMTCYLVDMADYSAFNDVYLEYFPDAETRPARVCIAVRAATPPRCVALLRAKTLSTARTRPPETSSAPPPAAELSCA